MLTILDSSVLYYSTGLYCYVLCLHISLYRDKVVDIPGAVFSWHCNDYNVISSCTVGWEVGDARVRGKVGKSGVHNRGPVMGTLYCGNS